MAGTSGYDSSRLDQSIVTFDQARFPEIIPGSTATTDLHAVIGGLLLGDGTYWITNGRYYDESGGVVVGDKSKTGHDEDDGVIILVQQGGLHWDDRNPPTERIKVVAMMDTGKPPINAAYFNINPQGECTSGVGTYAQHPDVYAKYTAFKNPDTQLEGAMGDGTMNAPLRKVSGNAAEEQIEAYLLQMTRILGTCAIDPIRTGRFASFAALHARSRGRAGEVLRVVL